MAWITKSLLDDYRNDSRGQRVPIESLSDLSKAVASKFGLRPDEVYMSQRFGVSGKVKKAVFVPFEEEDREKTDVDTNIRGGTPDGYMVTGNKDGGENPPLTQPRQENGDPMLPESGYIDGYRVTEGESKPSNPSVVTLKTQCNFGKVTQNKCAEGSINQSRDSEDTPQKCNHVTKVTTPPYNHDNTGFIQPLKSPGKCELCGEDGANVKSKIGEETIIAHRECVLDQYPQLCGEDDTKGYDIEFPDEDEGETWDLDDILGGDG